ncbi:hypothetical protein BH10BAC3_BH10BAC3_41180 [soil metagenome]
MQKIISTFLVCFIVTNTFGQTQKKVTTYLLTQYNKTISDRTIGNNPWGVGLGLQTFFNNKSKFKPTIDLTGDIYLEDDKVFRTNTDGSPINDVRGMVNLFFGSSYDATKSIYVSLVAGPSFISGQTLIGIKPSFGFYFPKTHKWTGKISYINIFNRDKTTKEDFSSLSLSVGLKLF